MFSIRRDCPALRWRLSAGRCRLRHRPSVSDFRAVETFPEELPSIASWHAVTLMLCHVSGVLSDFSGFRPPAHAVIGWTKIFTPSRLRSFSSTPSRARWRERLETRGIPEQIAWRSRSTSPGSAWKHPAGRCFPSQGCRADGDKLGALLYRSPSKCPRSKVLLDRVGEPFHHFGTDILFGKYR